jgi:hypothetical protein
MTTPFSLFSMRRFILDCEKNLIAQLIAEWLWEGPDHQESDDHAIFTLQHEKIHNRLESDDHAVFTLQHEKVQNRLVLDLRPYIDREPAVVLSSGSLRKAHDYLRAGEYSVLVARPESVQIVGVISRHDLMPAVMAATLKQKNRQLKSERKERKERTRMLRAGAVEEEASVMDTDDSVGTGGEGKGSEILSLQSPRPPLETQVSRVRVDSLDQPLKSQVVSELLPFEPRFYELLYHYWMDPPKKLKSTTIGGATQGAGPYPAPAGVQTYDTPLRSPDRVPTTRDLTVTEEALTRVRGSSSPDQPRYTLAKKTGKYR